MLENLSFRIIEENCTTYKEKQELYDLLESSGVKIGEKMVANLYDKTLMRAEVNFGDIPASKGNVENCSGYITVVSTLSVLSSLSTQYKVKIPEITLVEQAISLLKSNRDIFEKAFKMQSDALMMYYNALVYSCIEGTSILISRFVDFVKKPNEIKMVIKKGSANDTVGQICFDNLTYFVNSCKNGEFVKLSRQLLTGTISSGVNNVIAESVMGGIGAGILIAASLVPVLRTIIYYFYYSKMMIANFLEQQSYFLQMNEANINSSISEPSKRKEVLNRQKALVKKFEDMSDKIRVNSKVTTTKVNAEIKNENKNWTLDSVKSDNFGIL